MKTIFFLTVVVSLLACSAAPAQQPGRDAPRASADRTITTKELDDRWQAIDPAAQAEATQKLYDGRRAALDAIIADMLIAEAAQGEEHDRRGLRDRRRSASASSR